MCEEAPRAHIAAGLPLPDASSGQDGPDRVYLPWSSFVHGAASGELSFPRHHGLLQAEPGWMVRRKALEISDGQADGA